MFEKIVRNGTLMTVIVLIITLLGVLAACQVQLADRGWAVAGAAGGVQGGGIPPW